MESSLAGLLIARLENYVKRGEKHDNACAVNEIAGDADTKQSFVRQDIRSGFRGVVLHNQTVVDPKIDIDHGREGD
jgi:hypothetical protein